MNNQTSILSDADLDHVCGGQDSWTHRPTGTTTGSGTGLSGPYADFTKGSTKGVSGMALGSGR